MLFGHLVSVENHQKTAKIHFGVSDFVSLQPIAAGG